MSDTVDTLGIFNEATGIMRNREERLASSAAVSAPTTPPAVGLASVVGDDQTGYWDGSQYHSYFLVGVSLLNGSDVMK